jgi:superfamily II DNA or RNA helicase
MQLRPYQESAVQFARQALAKEPACLIQQPTGAGKTVTFAAIIQLIRAKGKSVWVLVNRKELLKQASQTLTRSGILHEVYNADTKTLPVSPIVVASADTLTRRKQTPTADFAIIDECHLSGFDNLVELLKTAGTKPIGFTATPIRNTKGKTLQDLYHVMQVGPTILELIEANYLNDCHSWGCKTDLSALTIKNGEYTIESQDQTFTSKATLQSVLVGMQRHSLGCNLVFTPSVASSIELCEFLNDNGFKARHMDGSMSNQERTEIDQQLRDGIIDTIVNCAVLTFGYDNPIINTIVVNRATTSLALWLQMCGRGSRLYEGKDRFHVLDFGGNIVRHSHWQQEHDWQKWFSHRQTKKEDVIPTMVGCPECDYWYSVSLPACPECGFVKPEPEVKEVTKVDKEVVYLAFGQQRLSKTYLAKMSIDELEAYRVSMGYHANWTAHLLVKDKPKLEAIEQLKALGHARGKRDLTSYALKYYEHLGKVS